MGAGLPSPSLEAAVPTKAAPVMFEKRASVEERISVERRASVEQRASSEPQVQPAPLSVDVSHRLSDSEQMPSPACRATPQPSKLNGGDPPEALSPAPRKGEESTNGSSSSPPEPSESLLRPLLAAQEEEPPAELPPSLPTLGPRKRSRRNTGSSAASDRSDLSAVSEPGTKRRRGSSKLADSEVTTAADPEALVPTEREVSPQDEEIEEILEEVEECEEDDLEDEEEESNSESETDERPLENNGGEKNG